MILEIGPAKKILTIDDVYPLKGTDMASLYFKEITISILLVAAEVNFVRVLLQEQLVNLVKLV